MERLGASVDRPIIDVLRESARPEFLQVPRYQIATGGKRIRAALAILSNRAAGGKLSSAVVPAAVVEMIHNYSLIIDDIIDHARVRRSRPTLRAKYGDSFALLAAMTYREAIERMLMNTARSQEMTKIATRTMQDIIEGERLDMLFEQIPRPDPYHQSNRVGTVNMKEYLNMISLKTASLFRASCLLGALSANGNRDLTDTLTHYGHYIGLAFQVRDDILDILGGPTGKEKGKDLAEHKMGNIVVICYLEACNGGERSKFLSVLRRKSVTSEHIRLMTEMISETGAKEESQRYLGLFVDRAKRSLQKLPSSRSRNELLEVATLVATRSY